MGRGRAGEAGRHGQCAPRHLNTSILRELSTMPRHLPTHPMPRRPHMHCALRLRSHHPPLHSGSICWGRGHGRGQRRRGAGRWGGRSGPRRRPSAHRTITAAAHTWPWAGVGRAEGREVKTRLPPNAVQRCHRRRCCRPNARGPAHARHVAAEVPGRAPREAGCVQLPRQRCIGGRRRHQGHGQRGGGGGCRPEGHLPAHWGLRERARQGGHGIVIRTGRRGDDHWRTSWLPVHPGQRVRVGLRLQAAQRSPHGRPRRRGAGDGRSAGDPPTRLGRRHRRLHAAARGRSPGPSPPGPGRGRDAAQRRRRQHAARHRRGLDATELQDGRLRRHRERRRGHA
mmetsp:Transcript_5608/g.21195  ORF Transcript_5608/g.21195 Transcript_5608/m.21195 type:complete len:340 (-) Transcript_5608:1552-2571(-)